MKTTFPTSGSGLSIALLADDYPCDANQAIGLPAVAFARQLVDRGHRVTVFASNSGPRESILKGIQILRISPSAAPGCSAMTDCPSGGNNLLAHTLNRISEVSARVRLPGFVRRIGGPGTFDIVHAWGSRSTRRCAQLLARECKAPLIASPWSFEKSRIRGTGFTRRENGWLRDATLITTPSASLADLVLQHSGCRATVVPWGALFAPPPSGTVVDDIPRVLFAGRLDTASGITYLVRAAPYILPASSAKLVLLGQGELASSLQRLAELLKISQSIEFVLNPTVRQYQDEFNKCHLFVAPQSSPIGAWNQYGFPGIPEAFALGKPVVGTRAADQYQLIRDGQTGWNVEPQDEFALAKRILDMLHHRPRAAHFGEVGRSQMNARFDWGTILARMEKLYEEAIARQLQAESLTCAGQSC